MFGWPVDWVVAVLQLRMLETKCSPGPARRSVRAGCAIILAHLGVLGRNVHHQKLISKYWHFYYTSGVTQPPNTIPVVRLKFV